jgi:hypothetical protein
MSEQLFTEEEMKLLLDLAMFAGLRGSQGWASREDMIAEFRIMQPACRSLTENFLRDYTKKWNEEW